MSSLFILTHTTTISLFTLTHNTIIVCPSFHTHTKPNVCPFFSHSLITQPSYILYFHTHSRSALVTLQSSYVYPLTLHSPIPQIINILYFFTAVCIYDENISQGCYSAKKLLSLFLSSGIPLTFQYRIQYNCALMYRKVNTIGTSYVQ